MKRFLVPVLVLSLVLSLAACNSGEKPPAAASSPDDTAPLSRETPPAVLPGDTVTENITLDAAIGDGHILSEADEATRRMWAAAAQSEGGDLTFEDDGSTVYTDANGSVTTQYPDGSWSSVSADGSTTQVGGGWPENEYTTQLPAPPFSLYGASTDENGFTVAFSDAPIDQIKAYAEYVQEKGFTYDAQTDDQSMGTIAQYSFSARNADGYLVEIFSADGMSGLSIHK